MGKSEYASTTGSSTRQPSRMVSLSHSRTTFLESVAGHECYIFLDGLSGYNQIRMHPQDQEKTSFVTEWGVFVAEVDVRIKNGVGQVPAHHHRNF